MSEIIIRNETEADYRTVEEVIRKAFWNMYVPGCDEHYVAHKLRFHEDFVPELDYVIELEHQVIGSVMYTKSGLRDESGNEKTVLTFGPVGILPEYQRRGYGKMLLEYSFEKALEMGYDTIVIFGNPENYVGRGFKSCRKYNVCVEDGSFPTALLVKELKAGALGGRKWVYVESPAGSIDRAEAQRFDQQFEKMEKKYQPSQEEFYILSHSVIR